MADQTFQQIQDEVMLNVYGVPSQTTTNGVSTPTMDPNVITHVQNRINKAYEDIVNMHQDWVFLNQVKQVGAWTVDLENTLSFNSGTEAATFYTTPNFTASSANYIGQQFNNTANTPIQLNYTMLDAGIVGITANVNTTWTCIICPDYNGQPNLDPQAAWGTSSAVPFIGQGLAGPQTTTRMVFNFPIPSAVPQNSLYWVVFKVVNTPGFNLATQFAIAQITGTSPTCMTMNPATAAWGLNQDDVGRYAWTPQAFGLWMQINYNNAYYTQTIYVNPSILGTGIKKILSFYDKKYEPNRLYTLTVMEERTDDFYLPPGSAMVMRIDVNGIWEVQFRTDVVSPLYWWCEYEATSTPMVNPTDMPIVPPEYRCLIVDLAILMLRADGRGLNSPDNLKLIQGSYAEGLRKMEIDYRPANLRMEPDVNSYGHTPRYITMSPGYNNKRRGYKSIR